MRPSAIAVLLLAGLASASTLQFRHRIVLPNDVARSTPFVQRGTIQWAASQDSHNLQLRSVDSAFEDIERWMAKARPEDLETALYQVTMQRANDAPDVWDDLQSVRLCHLLSSSADILSLQLAGDQETPRVYAFDYYVSPVPRDGSCVATTPTWRPLSNTTVALRSLYFPPVTQLRTPIPLSQTGEPIVPPVEKSFVQKYWMYMVGGVMLLAVAIPEPAEEAK